MTEKSTDDIFIWCLRDNPLQFPLMLLFCAKQIDILFVYNI